MPSELENCLRAFDGNAVSILSEARAECRTLPGYFEELISLCADKRPNVSVGATWVLKAEADEGIQFGTELIDPLLDALDEIFSWQAKLHILQSVEALKLNKRQAHILFNWAMSHTDHSRPFVRAWSLHAIVMIGMRFKELLPEAKGALLLAAGDKAASVRARVRNLKQHVQGIS